MARFRACIGRAGAVVVLGCVAVALTCGEAHAAVCGEQTNGNNPVPHAGLTVVPSTASIDLGNTNGGERQFTFDVTVDNTCTLPTTVPVSFGVFAGQFHDLNGKALDGTATVDGSLVRVAVTVQRSAVRPGKYEGVVHVGNGSIGFATAQMTITRQSPLLWVPIALGILGMFGGIMLAGLRNLHTDNAAQPTLVTTARATSKQNLQAKRAGPSKPSRARVVGGSIWRTFLAVLMPVESTIRFIVDAAHGVVVNQNFWPVIVGIGAAITAFVATYANDVSWSATIGSTVGLLTKVGGAAFAAAFAAWQPAGHH